MSKLFSGVVSRRSFITGALYSLPVVLLSPYNVFPNNRKRPFSLRRTTFAMGTVISIEAFGSNDEQINHAISRCFDMFTRLDAMMSVYDDDSQVSYLNRNAGKSAVTLSEELQEVIQRAVVLSNETKGAFDLTLEPFMKLWGFRDQITKRESIPTDREIRNALESSGMHNIVIDGEHISLSHLNTRIDLGGIAVGYSVDKAVQILREEGIESAFINHSGDAFALGVPPETDGWKCVVPNPLSPNEYIKEFTISNCAVSTSANTEKFVTFGTKKFGHILDPQTGRPSEVVTSTTVITNTSLEADAFSTAYFTMRSEDGIASARLRADTKLITSTLEDNRLQVYSS